MHDLHRVRVQSIVLRPHPLLRPLAAAASAVQVVLLPRRHCSALSSRPALSQIDAAKQLRQSRFWSDWQARSRPATRRTCLYSQGPGDRRMFAGTIRNTPLPGAGRALSTDAVCRSMRPVAVYPDAAVIDLLRRERYEAYRGSRICLPLPGIGDLRLRPIPASPRQRSLRLHRLLPASPSPAPIQASPPGVFTPPQRASSYAGTWKATRRLVVLQGPALERPLAGSLQGFDARAVQRRHARRQRMELPRQPGRPVLARAAGVARLSGAEAALAGTLSGSERRLIEMTR